MPMPSLPSFDALNAYLEERCLERLGARLRGCDETIGERMERDLEALLPLPDAPYDAVNARHLCCTAMPGWYIFTPPRVLMASISVDRNWPA